MNDGIQNGGRAAGPAGFFKEYFPVVFLIPTVAYCGVIFYLSSLPSVPLPPPFPHFDKLMHFLEFGGLGALIVAGMWRAEREFSAGMLFAVPVAFCLIYGLSDEIHQSFVEGRTYDLFDLAADVAGAAVAAGLLLYVLKRIGPKGLKKQGGDNG